MARQYGRNKRVSDLIQRELAVLIQRELNDSSLGMVTISVVDVSPDLKKAKVYVTSLGDNVELPKVIESLDEMSGHFRHELSQILPMRVTPKLSFVYDKSIEHGSRLSALIDSLNKKDS